MVKEELEEVFGFFVFVSNDTPGEPLIHVQGLLTCDRMNADNRMLVKSLSKSLEAFGK